MALETVPAGPPDGGQRRRGLLSEPPSRCEAACKPDSVIRPAKPGGRQPSIWGLRCHKPRCGLPGTRSAGHRRPCLALLRVGFTEPPRSPGTLVGSYSTVSPLPVRRTRGSAPSAVCSLLHFPSGHPAWELPSTLPCGVRTFLCVQRLPGGLTPSMLSRPRTGRAGSRRRSPPGGLKQRGRDPWAGGVPRSHRPRRPERSRSPPAPPLEGWGRGCLRDGR